MSPIVQRVFDRFFPPPQPHLAEAIHTARAIQTERFNYERTIAYLNDAVGELSAVNTLRVMEENERESEMEEALAMSSSGPWRMPGAETKTKPVHLEERGDTALRESPISAQGAYGDIELALQNIEWRREINLSWMEFSRWGIQQIILISRLYYIKNPMIQRGINVAAHYVFGRGVEVSSPDDDANDVLKEFFERNKRTLGQIALTDLERRKYYDGNIFFTFFSDTTDKGLVSVRTIDATEIMDIITDPDDTDTPWLYKRCWTRKAVNPATATVEIKQMTEWYPALGYNPDDKPPKISSGSVDGSASPAGTIASHKVNWDSPILHRKCGGVSKWHFGCPLVYAALDWAKAATRFLEACATVKKALATIAMTFTSKGGQQALQGAKSQLSTTVGPSSSPFDQNPPPVNASIFASGPGTTLAAFKTTGAGGDPEEVRQFKLQVAMVFGLPESFFSDMQTSNLATATSLDRPTQLNFMEKQEAWREDLTTIAKYVLMVSKGAPGGKLRESLEKRYGKDSESIKRITIYEAKRVFDDKGNWHYEVDEAKKPLKTAGDHKIEVLVTFPSIIESDTPANINAIVNALTLGNKGGQIVGIDEKVGVGLLYQELAVENSQDILEEQYPDKEYDADRTKEDLTAPIPRIPQFSPGGKPQLKAGQPQVQQPVAAPPKKPKAKTVAEALGNLTESVRKLVKVTEASQPEK